MEYRYITQEVIDSGGRNITSPEMFEEARQYNIEAAKNYNRRHGTHVLFNVWMIVQFIYFVYKVIKILSETTMKQFGDGSYTKGTYSVDVYSADGKLGSADLILR